MTAPKKEKTREDYIVDKIRALLAKVDDRAVTEDEAISAAEKAQELMLKYGIELARIAAETEGPLGIGKERYTGMVDPWRRILAYAVATSMGGTSIYGLDAPRKWSGWIQFYGPTGTVASIVALFSYLEAQLVVISRIEAIKAGPHATAAKSMQWRRSFLAGAVDRLAVRLEERAKRIEEETDNSTALVVLKDAVQAAMDFDFPGNRNLVIKRRIDGDAYEVGHEAAGNLDLLDPQLRGQGALTS